MKMIQPKKQMSNLLLVACLLTSAVGVATVKGVATGEEPAPAPTVTYETLAMEEGASVRIADKKEDAGIRFRLKMSKTEYEAITAQNSPYQNVSFGVLVAPEDYLTAGHELNEKNVFGANAIYGWATRNEDGTWNEYEGNKVEIINFNTTTLSLKEGEYRFDGSLVDIMDGTETTTNNVSREFRGVGYMRYTDNGTEKYVMVGDETNVRSIAYVAQKAIEAGQVKDQTDIDNLTKFYITGVESKATVNYYKYGENGYEVADTVQSDNMQIGDIFNIFDAEKKSYDGYIFDNANSELSGKVYANGKTTLNVYYNPMDNLAPTVDSWMLLQNGRWKASDVQYDYVPNVTELTLNSDNKISNLNVTTARYKLTGENQTELTYKDSSNVEKWVAQSYPIAYGNNNCHSVLVGANLSSLTKADLQTLAENGYLKLTFSFVYNSKHARYPNYYVLDFDKVKNNPELSIRDDKGFINLEVLKIATGADSGVTDQNMLNKRWITVTYSMADLIACYDQLFAGEEYWTLAIPYGDVFYTAEETGCFYMSKLAFERTVNNLSDVLPELNDWAVMLGGYSQGYDCSIDYNPEFTSDNVPLVNSGTEDAPKWIIDNRNLETLLYKSRQASLVGRAENITYKNKNVAFSFSMPANGSRLPIYIGAGLSNVTKADLETLLALGYTKLSFSFVHNTCQGVVQQAGYWLLDLETVKANPDMKLRVTENTKINGADVTKGRLNLAAFKQTGHNYNNCNGASKEWINVEYAIADLIACYDQLFAGEEYWTLAIPYGNVGAYNYNAEWNQRDVARTYVTKLAFTK